MFINAAAPPCSKATVAVETFAQVGTDDGLNDPAPPASATSPQIERTAYQPVLGVTDFLVEIAENFCATREATMTEITAYVLQTLDTLAERDLSSLPLAGRSDKEYIFRQKGKDILLSPEKVIDRIRKDDRVRKCAKPSKSWQGKNSD